MCFGSDGIGSDDSTIKVILTRPVLSKFTIYVWFSLMATLLCGNLTVFSTIMY